MIKFLASGTSSILALPGCAVEASDPQPGDEEPTPAASPVEDPGLDPQGPEFCCYADCKDTPGKDWQYVGKPPYGHCAEAAKWYCKGLGTSLNKADWRPCP
jgi:hypothetical protein